MEFGESIPALVESLPMSHSWPIFESGTRLDLGCEFAPQALAAARALPELTSERSGRWTCDLTNEKVTWTDGIFDLFGLPINPGLTRADALALYADHSRAMMEQIRAYAIKHRRGFTIDAELRPASGGGPRWMRLTGAPLCRGGRVVALYGMKQDISAEYLG